MRLTACALALVSLLTVRPGLAAADEIADRVAEVSLANIQAHVATLAAAPRDDAASQEAAADYVDAMLSSYGYAVTRDPVGSSENVRARLEGTLLPTAVFVVGAHFDSVAGSPGADDNASGVAGMLEIARVLAGKPRAATIDFVAFAHEESGLLGSNLYANQAIAAGEAVLGMYSLEMIGYTCASPCQFPFIDLANCLQVSTPLVTEGDFIGLVSNFASFELVTRFVDTAAAYVPSLPIEWANVAENGGCFADTRRSDHARFWDKGLPALMVTDTANFRNPNYHLPSDTPGTLDYAFAQQVTQAALATVMASTTPVDIGVTATKLIIVDKTAATGQAKVVYAAKKDLNIGKGAGGDPPLVEGAFEVVYTDTPTSVRGAFLLPAPWLVNKDTVAKYVNKDAPAGSGAVKVGVVKPEKVAKVVAKDLGDAGDEIDLFAGPPSDTGGVTTAFTIANGADGSVTRMCTRFAVADGSTVAYKEIAGGSGRKLVAKNGVASACP